MHVAGKCQIWRGSDDATDATSGHHLGISSNPFAPRGIGRAPTTGDLWLADNDANQILRCDSQGQSSPSPS